MIILGTNSIKDTGYDVANSVRMDGSSAYMTRTMGTPTDADKYTFSFWCKRSKLGVQQSIFRSTNGNNDSHVTFQADDTLRFEEYGGLATIGKLQTTQVFRDVSAWYHIVLIYDSGNATAGNRMRMYVNGTEVTSFGTDTNPSQDADSFFNKSGEPLHFGRTDYSGGGNYFSGYVAELVMVDGQALTPSSFGEFDEDSPTIWKPKNVSGLTFGDNGFYLDFEDSGDLGDDESGNGNDFTEYNLAAADQATDTPTNNFCTMNPLDNYYASSTFSEGNCHVLTNSSNSSFNTSTFAVSSGKWYWEAKIGSNTTVNNMFGVADRVTSSTSETVGTFTTSYSLLGTGRKYENNSYTDSWGDSYTTNDIMSVALDLDNNRLFFAKNGTWQNSGDPTSSTGAISITAAASTSNGVYFPAFGDFSGSDDTDWLINFGGCPAFTISSGNADANGYGNFEYSVPSGYLALCTKNLGSDGG